MPLARLTFAAPILALAALAQAAPQAPLSIPDLVKKADYLIVGQVTRIEDLGQTVNDTYKFPLMRKRATLRVYRGMKASDATSVDFTQIAVDYLAAVDAAGADVPFPQLYVGQVGLFPVVAGAEKNWRFAVEEDRGMIAPAIPLEIGAGWPADVPGNVAFYYRELAGAITYGDFPTMVAAAAYMDSLGPAKENPADYVFALTRAEIGDSLLREDTRWVTIACAAYCAAGSPRPSLDALINGMVDTGNTTPRAPTDALPVTPSLRLAMLNFRKASKYQLAERILMLLINHQEDPGVSWGIAKTLVDNFGAAPMLISMEKPVMASGKPGALYVADYMVKDAGHPLAAAAVAGARVAIGPEGAARDIPDDVSFTPVFRQAEGLILRAGNDDDFAYLLDEINQAHLHDPKAYQAILLLAGDSELSPTPRVLEICRQYIGDDKPLLHPPFPGFRLCDMAALTAARLGKQDFGLSPTDPVEKRDLAVAKAAEWLKAKQ